MTKAAELAGLGSVIAAPTGTAPGYVARAWVNFNGTGTVAIRGSGNVSSITDNAVGSYTANFTIAMQDGNYVVVGSLGPVTTGGESVNPNIYSTTSIQFATSVNLTNTDRANVNVTIFR